MRWGFICSFLIFFLCYTGSDKVRPYWDRYYQVFQAIIFVIKSTASDEEMELAKQELYKALKHPQLKALPLLLLANYSDGEGARSAEEVSVPPG